MPGYKIDFVYDIDFFNLSVSTSKKVTPAWKVKLAPKLGPPKAKAQLADKRTTPKPPSRPSINSTRFPISSDDKTPRITDVTETEKEETKDNQKPSAKRALQPASANPGRKIPKLQEKGNTKAKAVSAKTSAKPQINGAK
jgi:hypothetical protein